MLLFVISKTVFFIVINLALVFTLTTKRYYFYYSLTDNVHKHSVAMGTGSCYLHMEFSFFF